MRQGKNDDICFCFFLPSAFLRHLICLFPRGEGKKDDDRSREPIVEPRACPSACVCATMDDVIRGRHLVRQLKSRSVLLLPNFYKEKVVIYQLFFASF